MTFPKRIMKDIVWSFRESYPDRVAFIDEVRDYHLAIVKSTDRWRPDEVVLTAPRVHITYEHWEGDDQLDRTTTFTADDGRAFTTGELLWKINEDAAPRLQNQDHKFFEGLDLGETEGNDPTYDMHLGS